MTESEKKRLHELLEGVFAGVSFKRLFTVLIPAGIEDEADDDTVNVKDDDHKQVLQSIELISS